MLKILFLHEMKTLQVKPQLMSVNYINMAAHRSADLCQRNVFFFLQKSGLFLIVAEDGISVFNDVKKMALSHRYRSFILFLRQGFIFLTNSYSYFIIIQIKPKP